MSRPPIITAGPSIESDVPSNVRRHLQLIYQKLGNHTQAISIIADKSSGPTATTATASSVSNTSGGGSTSGSVLGIQVNNQSGVTSYSTTVFDNGSLIVLSDASPVAVSLVPQVTPYGFFISNQGAGTVTLTPSSGTINGAATFAVTSNQLTIVAFDGANWWASTQSIVPVTFAAVAHEWLNSYNAATGTWTAAQPAFSDISGKIASGQLPSSGLSVTITTAKLTTLGTNGSQTFTNGQLTAQVQAT